MLYELHYMLISAGTSATGILIGVFMQTYTNAGSLENGLVFMILPIANCISRPVICSIADREAAHQKYLIWNQVIVAASFIPFIVIPYLGPEIYVKHPTCCYWILVVCKAIGDMAFGGMKSLSDALAINYSHRIGTSYGCYRVWGSISYMIFGVIIGFFNEISLVPKFVPGFAILILTSLLDVVLVWLWPAEFFQMVPVDRAKSKEAVKPGPWQQLNTSLLPKEVVWEHAKSQMRRALRLVCRRGRVQKQLSTEIIHQSHGIDDDSCEEPKKKAAEETPVCIPMSAQLKAFGLIFKRDKRLGLYLIVFTLNGIFAVSASFFVLYLAARCHTGGQCHFSQLVGAMQVSISLSETIMYIYIYRIQRTIGCLNMCAMAFALFMVEYAFFASIYPYVSPYYAPLTQMAEGIVRAIYITVIADMAHEFAGEVEFVLPELASSGAVKSEAEEERMRLSLAATMQAIVSQSQNGLGRILGSIVFGVLLGYVDYSQLWTLMALTSTIIFLVLAVCSVISRSCNIVMGLEQKHALATSKGPATVQARV